MATDDFEAIRQLKARYFRMVDTKDWAGMRRLFADDVTVDLRSANVDVIHGADEFMTVVENTLRDVLTVHHGHMPEIELTSPTTATGIWAMEDRLRWPDGTELHGFGHYHETYEKVDGEWQIKTLLLTRLRVDHPVPAST